MKVGIALTLTNESITEKLHFFLRAGNQHFGPLILVKCDTSVCSYFPQKINE